MSYRAMSPQLVELPFLLDGSHLRLHWVKSSVINYMLTSNFIKPTPNQ